MAVLRVFRPDNKKERKIKSAMLLRERESIYLDTGNGSSWFFFSFSLLQRPKPSRKCLEKGSGTETRRRESGEPSFNEERIFHHSYSVPVELIPDSSGASTTNETVYLSMYLSGLNEPPRERTQAYFPGLCDKKMQMLSNPCLFPCKFQNATTPLTQQRR